MCLGKNATQENENNNRAKQNNKYKILIKL